MKDIVRYLLPGVKQDLERKMVFIAGPRQSGKTTMGLSLPGADKAYLNWDVPEHREKILKRELPAGGFWFFDEIHKFHSWRNYLKGLFDGRQEGQQILVTGSAMLDFYRFSGDSLQGRYHLLRLHPFSVAELGCETEDDFQQLLTLGGFPEPFLSGSEQFAKRWSREYRNLLVREEVTSLERVNELGELELLMLRLPDLVGSLLSINALREDLQKSHKTVSSWLNIMERLYAIFRISPFGAPPLRAIKKSRKHYHFDWSIVPEVGPRFENMVACHLQKWVHFRQDAFGEELDLCFFRDSDGREVDFIVTDSGKPVMAVECKSKGRQVDKNLRYFKKRFPDCRAWQVVAFEDDDYISQEGIRVCHALEFLQALT